MAGDIYLGGGGSAGDEADLWRVMLAGKSRIIYWPFALPHERIQTAERWLVGALEALEVDVVVETWIDLVDHTPGQLTSAELLFVGGGNSFRLLDHVRNRGFVNAVREFVADGGDYYGGSAGALLACGSVQLALRLDENDVDLKDMSALGLVREFDVLPHFDPNDLVAVSTWSAEHSRCVLGVPERTGVSLRSGTIEVHGLEPAYEIDGKQVTLRNPGERWTRMGR